MVNKNILKVALKNISYVIECIIKAWKKFATTNIIFKNLSEHFENIIKIIIFSLLTIIVVYLIIFSAINLKEEWIVLTFILAIVAGKFLGLVLLYFII